MSSTCWALVLATLAGAPPTADGPAPPVDDDNLPRLLILDLKVGSGTDPEAAGVVQSMLTSRITSIGKHQVISKADITTMVGVETQKQLLGCGDDACLAEIGGALGAKLILAGGLSRLGDSPVLSLSLIDTQKTRVAGNITKTLSPDANEWSPMIREAAYEILGLPVPPPEIAPWYARPWVWVVGGVVLVGAGVGVYALTRTNVDDANLGREVLVQ